ncbi:DNA-binding transcriptional MocR family regulator [Bacillus pakistanensis]|uniref:DNA-binding transcriptional MocR family regulator n=1 Tax=Rossellomorea pakistanensis TaxID=992288 RepID=A0ABS2N6S2_9BACI|nr:PLP-dependent aminotransferase family protein [Bacillus pakistanensis]MBM7583524.1 DNA-binding transcriptional MocR family regulator [Bacillus pakistanensis]
MDWKPDRNANKALYKQLAEYIENGIADGTFPADKPLPSERKMAKELGVNRSTVVSAYDELEADGLIVRTRGSGTTISQDIWGMSKKRVPSWNRYIESGSFLPNHPVVQRIRKEAEEIDMINLASGELSPDLFPSKVLRKLTSTRSFIGNLGHDHPLGNEILRRTIKEHVKDYRDIETNPESILITSGAQQALHLIVQCLLKPGDAVVLEDPSYHYNLQIFKSAGVNTYLLTVEKDGMDPEELVRLYKKHRVKMIFLNPAFQNPTGVSVSDRHKQRIIEISLELGIPIVEDDPYSITSFSGKKISTLKSMDETGNVLYISSLSKIVAAGLRIGWIIGPRAVIERLADAKQQVDFGHASFSQWVANEFLESKEFHLHLTRLLKNLESRRNMMIRSLQSYLRDQVEFNSPQGGIHLWCKLNRNVNETKLLEDAIREGVIFVPGSSMGSREGYVRFTYARENEERIDLGISRFAESLRMQEK